MNKRTPVGTRVEMLPEAAPDGGVTTGVVVSHDEHSATHVFVLLDGAALPIVTNDRWLQAVVGTKETPR